MKSGEELYSKMYQSPELPQRIVLKPNEHCGRQDTPNLEARASVDHLSSEYGETRSGREYGETRCGDINFRIQGLPHSTVQQQDDTRKEAVKKLIHQLVEGHDPQHGKHGVLRDVRDHFQSTMPQLFNILDDRHVYCTCGTCLGP